MSVHLSAVSESGRKRKYSSCHQHLRAKALPGFSSDPDIGLTQAHGPNLDYTSLDEERRNAACASLERVYNNASEWRLYRAGRRRH